MNEWLNKETQTPSSEMLGARAGSPVSIVADICDFFSTSKLSPQKFIGLRQKHGMRVPSEEEISKLGDHLFGDDKLLDRLVSIAAILPIHREPDSLNTIVLKLLHRVLARAVPSLSAIPAGQSIVDLIAAAEVIRRGTKAKRRQHLFKAVYVLEVIHRGVLDQGDVDEFIEGVFTTPPKKKKKSQNRHSVIITQPMEDSACTLLRVVPREAMLRSAIEIRKRYQLQIYEISNENVNLRSETDRLISELSNNQQAMDGAKSRIKVQEEQISDLQTQCASLQKVVKAETTNSLHDRQMLKARVKGSLRGELTRWLQTAQDAATASPARINVITERLAQSLNLIEKEAQWLESSD